MFQEGGTRGLGRDLEKFQMREGHYSTTGGVRRDRSRFPQRNVAEERGALEEAEELSRRYLPWNNSGVERYKIRQVHP